MDIFWSVLVVISSKKSWQAYKVTNVFKYLCHSNDTTTCLLGIFPVWMWEYGHRIPCILCSSNIKCQHLRGCVSGTRCHQIRVARQTADISVHYVCQAISIYLFHIKRRGWYSKHSHWKEKNVAFAFQGIASPCPSWSRWQLRHKETRPWCEQQWCKTSLIHVILTALVCTCTSLTEMEAGSGGLYIIIYFGLSSPLICHSKPAPLSIVYYLWNVFIFSESIC